MWTRMTTIQRSWHLTPDQNQPPPLPFLPRSLGEKPQNFAVEGLHLAKGLHLHLQQVIFAEFAFQVLDGTDTPGGRQWGQSGKGRENATYFWWFFGWGQVEPEQPADNHAQGNVVWTGHTWGSSAGTHLSLPDTMMATRSHTASASAM